MNRNHFFIRVVAFLMVSVSCVGVLQAQVPDMNEFVFVDAEPIALNLDSVRSTIGYPDEAINAEAQGTVVARILVDTSGNYVKHEIVRIIHPALALAVATHIDDLRFTPAMSGGKPIMFWTNIPFPFKLIQTEVVIQEQIDMLTEELSVEPEDYKIWHKRGIQYTQLGKYEEAKIDFDESLKLNPRLNKKKAKKNTYAYLFYAYYGRAVTLVGLEKGEEALSDYSEAIRVASELAIPDSSVEASMGDVYLERAYQKANMSQYSSAIDDYRVALAKADSSQKCGIWRLIVESALPSDNYPVLVEAYDALLTCDDNAKEIYYYSRAYYRRKSGDFDQAILDFRTAINETNNTAVKLAAQNYLAMSQFDAGLPADAMTSVEKALNMNALNPMSYYVRAIIRQKMEAPEAGCEDLKRAMIYGLAGEEMDAAKQLLEEVCGETWEE